MMTRIFFADSGDSMHVHKCQHEFIKKDSIVSKSHAHYFFLNQTIASNQKQIRFRFVSFRFAAVDIFFNHFIKYHMPSKFMLRLEHIIQNNN